MANQLIENRTRTGILLNMLLAAVSLFVNGFGIYLTIQANLGAAPWDVLSLGLSKTLGILYGTASVAVSLTILGIDVLMKEPVGIAMFIDAFVVGKSVDFFNWLGVVPPCRANEAHPHRRRQHRAAGIRHADRLAVGRACGRGYADLCLCGRSYHAGFVLDRAIRRHRGEASAAAGIPAGVLAEKEVTGRD